MSKTEHSTRMWEVPVTIYVLARNTDEALKVAAAELDYLAHGDSPMCGWDIEYRPDDVRPVDGFVPMPPPEVLTDA